MLSLSVIGGHLECVQFIVEHLYEGGNTTQETVDEKLARLEHLETMRTRRSPAMLALYHGKRERYSHISSAKGFRCAIRVDSPVRKHTASADTGEVLVAKWKVTVAKASVCRTFIPTM